MGLCREVSQLLALHFLQLLLAWPDSTQMGPGELKWEVIAYGIATLRSVAPRFSSDRGRREARTGYEAESSLSSQVQVHSYLASCLMCLHLKFGSDWWCEAGIQILG